MPLSPAHFDWLRAEWPHVHETATQAEDREAAKLALGVFTAGKTLGANQLEFVNLIVEHLTAHGAMEPALLYDSSFTDLNPQGPQGVFSAAQVNQLVRSADRDQGARDGVIPTAPTFQTLTTNFTDGHGSGRFYPCLSAQSVVRTPFI